MKNIIKIVIVASAFLGITNVALAQPTACQAVEMLSWGIMTVRQNGATLGDAMDSVNSPPPHWMSKDAGAAHQKLAKELVLEAFKVPRFNTIEQQEKAADDFSNKAVLACRRAK